MGHKIQKAEKGKNKGEFWSIILFEMSFCCVVVPLPFSHTFLQPHIYTVKYNHKLNLMYKVNINIDSQNKKAKMQRKLWCQKWEY